MPKFNFKWVLFVFIIALITTVVSCSKVDTTYTAPFSGTWIVDSDKYSGFDIEKFDISTGSTDYSVNVSYRVGHNSNIGGRGTPDDSCQRIITIKGISNSTTDKDYFSISGQTFTDRCGNNYTVNGSCWVRRPVLPNEHDTLYMNMVTAGIGTIKSYTLRGYKY